MTFLFVFAAIRLSCTTFSVFCSVLLSLNLLTIWALFQWQVLRISWMMKFLAFQHSHHSFLLFAFKCDVPSNLILVFWFLSHLVQKNQLGQFAETRWYFAQGIIYWWRRICEQDNVFVISNPREGSMVLQQDVRYPLHEDLYILNVLF